MTARREIFVCLERAPLAAASARPAPGERALARPPRRPGASEADLAAVEQAVRLREAGAVERVTCVAIAPAGAREPLEGALVAGADRAVRIAVAADLWLDAAEGGALLAAALRRLGAEIVLAAGAGPMAAFLAAGLGAAHLSSALHVRLGAGRVEVERRLERGNREVWTAPPPAVVALAAGAEAARYPSVAARLRARRQVFDELSPDEIGAPLERLPRPVELRRVAAARIRAKTVGSFLPGQSVAERLGALLTGGVTEKKERQILSGRPDTLAAEFVKLLETRQLLRGERGETAPPTPPVAAPGALHPSETGPTPKAASAPADGAAAKQPPVAR